MQLIERFQAEATDGRVVEILKWAPLSAAEPTMRDRMRALYSTLQGWRVDPQPDGDSYTIQSFGLTVHRVRPNPPRVPDAAP
jgi:hypothetical protein